MRRSVLIVAISCGLALLLAGCQADGTAPNWFAPQTPPDDVVRLAQYYSQQPWLRDPDKRITGLLVRVYLISSRTDKGVFAPGTVHVTLKTLALRPDGTIERIPTYEWTFDSRQAAPFRVRKTSLLGDSYGFVLRWPEELNLMGRKIEVAFNYERTDGRIVKGPPRQVSVDVPPGQRAGPLPPRPATPPASPESPPPAEVPPAMPAPGSSNREALPQ